MLKIKNLTVQYADTTTAAVDQFQLNMKQGEIICIVGESGSGKSTVLKAILGSLPQNCNILADQLLLQEEALLNFSQKDWQKLRGTKLSMIFQDNGAALNPIRKIGDQYIEYIRQHTNYSKKVAFKKAQEVLEKMQLADSERVMNSFPHQLSGGMCQRVGIAMAMTFEPQLLLADEPTSALDVTTQKQIVHELLALREQFKTSIILVTHNLGLAAYMADQLIVMQQGKIVDSGKVLDVLDNPQSDYTKQLLNAVPELGEKPHEANNLGSKAAPQGIYFATGKEAVGL